MNDLKAIIEKNLKILEDRIRTLKIEWDLFFTGNRRIPPTKELGELDKLVKTMKNTAIPDNVLRFKFQSVYSNFIAMSELWTKRLRQQEEGKLRVRPVRQTLMAAAPAQGIVITDPSAQQGRIKSLFNDFLTLSNPETVKDLNFQMFAVKISQQVEAIMRKTGCGEVRLSVRVEEGKVKLKAKPLKGEGA
jgi:hypothetical protein